MIFVNAVAFLLGTALMYATTLLYAALGGVVSENSGVFNIGLEGIMTMGAFSAAAVAYLTGNPLLAMIVAGAAGAILALILAVGAISFHGNQTVLGTALNFIGPGLALFISKKLFGGAQTPTIEHASRLPKLFDGLFPQGSFLNTIFNQDFGVYFALFLVVLIWFVLFKTRIGLRIRACGEHPKAAATLGINVKLIRYVCVLCSGVLGAWGGASLSIGVVQNFSPSLVSGQGFIALAALIFGRWKPQGVLAASLIFGFSKALVILINKSIPVNNYLLEMIPYFITLLILMFTSKTSAAPSADGVPYEEAG